MPIKVFINYRRDDVAGDARGIRDALATEFWRFNIFMDVDDLSAGQRFDQELSEAIRSTDVFVVALSGRVGCTS